MPKGRRVNWYSPWCVFTVTCCRDSFSRTICWYAKVKTILENFWHPSQTGHKVSRAGPGVLIDIKCRIDCHFILPASSHCFIRFRHRNYWATQLLWDTLSITPLFFPTDPTPSLQPFWGHMVSFAWNSFIVPSSLLNTSSYSCSTMRWGNILLHCLLSRTASPVAWSPTRPIPTI